MESERPTPDLLALLTVLGPSRAGPAHGAQNRPRSALFALLALALLALLAPPAAIAATSAKLLPPPPFEPDTKPKKKDKKQEDPDPAAPAAALSGTKWVVLLAAYRGADAQASAAATLNEARTLAGLADAYIEIRGENTIVAVGRFTAPDDAGATDLLQRVRAITIGNVRPYAGSFIAPPYTEKVGSRPEYNLQMARRLHPEGLYTLQVGVYGRDDLPRPTEADLKEVRKAAEDAAVKLRQEGELAFYHHGPNRSMVTIGVFDPDDFDPQTPGYQSQRLLQARKRFPHNLYNGAGIRETRPGRKPTLQPSFLVNIPAE